MIDRRRSLRQVCWTVGPATVLLLLALGMRQAPTLALVNESPSLKTGVYLRLPDRPIRRGDVVAAMQPAQARAYLGGLGLPAQVRLIKRVAAIGGDRVCVRDGILQLPSGPRSVLPRDRRGVPLPAWPGCRALVEGEVFLLGDTATSYDSRYFGPVPATSIQGLYRETLTW